MSYSLQRLIEMRSAAAHDSMLDDLSRGIVLALYDSHIEETQRLNWLELQHVQVRAPLLYGSRECFTANPEGDEEDPALPSDLRAEVDKCIAKSEA